MEIKVQVSIYIRKSGGNKSFKQPKKYLENKENISTKKEKEMLEKKADSLYRSLSAHDRKCLDELFKDYY